MKNLISIIVIITIFVSCKTKTANNTSDNDTLRKKMVINQNPKGNQVDVNYPPKLKTYYFLASGREYIDPEEFVYFLNNNECIMYKTRFSYSYNINNGIVTIQNNGEHSDPIYFKVYSGKNTENMISRLNVYSHPFEEKLNINENINNLTYALVSMVAIDNTTYSEGDYSGGVKIYVSKQIDNDNYFNDLFNKTIKSEKNVLVGLLGSLQNEKLITENKIDILEDKGENLVNQSLQNKSDYTYGSLIEKWNNINNREKKMELLSVSIKDQYTNEEFLHSSALVDILSSYADMRKMDTEYSSLNKILDGEVLPLLQSN